SILLSYPELKIEVAGYTDSHGSNNYNLLLANKRALSVIKYLTDEGISGSRLIKKAYGESNFVAINTNIDGSDNPEGRKYNRRVTIGIIDPQTGITISQESFIPHHLIQPYSLRYSIVLARSVDPLPTEQFRNLEIKELSAIRSLVIDSLNIYYIGIFHNRTDALKYLSYAMEKGFGNSYIVTQSEINSASKSLINSEITLRRGAVGTIYTIQLKAARQKINMNVFKDIKGVKEIASPDGYYRYVVGEYNSLNKAKEAIVSVNKSGYKDAFIRDLSLLLHY
ncbi:MAG: OmpA family protein, partial [Bacteroidia bacterium]|nr:OmpA family protein [Bacteroidia bacterium]